MLALTAAVSVAAEEPAEDAAAGLPPVAGSWQSALVEPDDTLLDVAYRARLGFEPVQRLNPEVPAWIPEPGTVVRLPTRYVLPSAPREGLVINVPEMRLYDFTTPGGPTVLGAAVGDPEDPTPVGAFRARGKRVDPAWRVPESIRVERPELPAVMPPGPDNPLGDRWIRLGDTSYGIHGTNIRWSIGREATHGCVRLYPDDMRALFDRTPEGTPIRIVYQPLKWGRDGEALVLEAHPDLYDRIERPLDEALQELAERRLLDAVDIEAVRRVVEETRGVPVRVGTVPAPPSASTSTPSS